MNLTYIYPISHKICESPNIILFHFLMKFLSSKVQDADDTSIIIKQCFMFRTEV